MLLLWKLIKSQCLNLTLDEVGDDFSFELTIKIPTENQGDVFYKILTMKNIFINISEISINLKSLENILIDQDKL